MFDRHTAHTHDHGTRDHQAHPTGMRASGPVFAEHVEAGDLAPLVAYLTEGYWRDQGYAPHAFDTSGSNRLSVNLDALTGDGKQLARWALEAWEAVADIVFVETGGGADIIFDDAGPGAFTSAVWDGRGDTREAEVNVSTDWLARYGTGIDSHSFATYLHEIGHALGLGHPGNYNGGADYGRDATFAVDSRQVSIMSYFDQDEAGGATDAALTSVMIADILAIQGLYGAPGSGGTTGTDTIWGPNSDLRGYQGRLVDALSGAAVPGYFTQGDALAFTLYDQGGRDHLDLRFSDAGDRVSLRAGGFSDVGGARGNLAIAYNTVIEDATTGDGDDLIRGNGASNRLSGGRGDDTIDGAGGADILFGGPGGDRLSGGGGADRLVGNRGDDTLSGQAGDDRLLGGGGNDRLSGATGDDGLRGGGGRDTLLGGAGADTLRGGDQDDRLLGQAGADTLLGSRGDDRLFGGAGRDVLAGGAGDDRLLGQADGDRLRGGGGDDTLSGGAGGDDLRGGGQDDRLSGGTGDDRLLGQKGGDTLLGGRGGDALEGGAGADRLSGQAGDDTLRGGAGDDRLAGGAGRDVLAGGSGGDVFVFTGGADTILDFSVAEGDGLLLSDNLWSGRLDAGQVIDRFLRPGAGDVQLDFGSGDELRLRDFADLDALESAITIV